jgi:putative PIN family toxin of toxin-antitoxin system
MKRVTVDTNIFISALFWKGKPDQVIEVFRQKQALLLVSEDILDELERKLNSAKFTDALQKIGSSPEEVVAIYRDLAEIVQAADVADDAVRDAKDRMILACAVGGNANVLVSGDKDLLALETY